MSDEDWLKLDEKALATIQLFLTREVLREVIHETIAAGLWLKLESLYITKSLANKIRLKDRLYTFRMKLESGEGMVARGRSSDRGTVIYGTARVATSKARLDDSKLWHYRLGHMGEKDEVFPTFKEWKMLIENQTGKKIKKLRTDNGLEFCGESFNALCQKYGIAR
nr:retrovirus-related Pol polyprotein from transposon TNT 1-94 [Tanacetum cinerariifolium]